jgi:hypothetical protein
MRELAIMRMICDTNYILDPEDRACPKLTELEGILEECCSDPDVKVIIFSEWERMLELVAGLCRRLKLGHAWHTGSVPQKRRRAEIQIFKTDPKCRVFLSTDSGGVGLNLQNASVVINCDLPWNPAKLEQRIARAWRKHQLRNVTVINLVSRDTIEHRMLGTLQAKQGLSEGVLDGRGDLDQIQLRSGAQAFLARLEQVIDTRTPAGNPIKTEPALPVDRSAAFAERAAQMLNGKLVACEERFPNGAAHSTLLVVVERDADLHREQLRPLHEQLCSGLDPLAPVTLEVIDRATADALKRLADAGLITGNVRATRHLHPAANESSNPLTPEEQQRIAARRDQSIRRLKMARLLAGGDLEEEARAALREAISLTAQVLAIKARLPEPSDLTAAFQPPLSHAWGESLSTLREFHEGGEIRPALDALDQRIESICKQV